MEKIKWLRVYINLWRILPLYLIVKAYRYKEKLKADIDVWIQNLVPTESKLKKQNAENGILYF